LNLFENLKNAFKAFRESPAILADIDGEEGKWQRLTGTDRDLSPMLVERAQRIAYYLYETNPMAKRLVNMTAEYVVSEGVKVKSEDAEIHDFLADFWTENDLDNLILHFATEYGLWGEQCWRLFPNEVNGRTRLGYIDPSRIKEVNQDPDNCLQALQVILKGEGSNLKEVPLNAVRKLALTEDGSSYFGDTLFFKANSVLRATRGRSDILASADYLDIYSEFVFSRAERSLFGNIFMWDVTCQQMNQAEIDVFSKGHPPPKPGAARFHNEKVEWKAVAPDLKAHDASYDARLLKGFNLGAVGYPEHFFGEAGDVNRATATEMNEPVMKMLTSRQRALRGMLTKVCNFVVDKGRAKRTIRPANPSPKDYQLYFPELSSKDMQKAGLTMQYLAQSLSIAEQAGWITKEGASRLYAQVASTFGPDIDPAYEEDPDWFEQKKKQEVEKRQGQLREVQGTASQARSKPGLGHPTPRKGRKPEKCQINCSLKGRSRPWLSPLRACALPGTWC
jgi:hypothetical protein